VPKPGEGWTLGGFYPNKLKVDLLGSRSQCVLKLCAEELWDDSQLPVEYKGSQKGLPKPPESWLESQNQLEGQWDFKPGDSWGVLECNLWPESLWSLEMVIPVWSLTKLKPFDGSPPVLS
jgi:hypothetical protein